MSSIRSSKCSSFILTFGPIVSIMWSRRDVSRIKVTCSYAQHMAENPQLYTFLWQGICVHLHFQIAWIATWHNLSCNVDAKTQTCTWRWLHIFSPLAFPDSVNCYMTWFSCDADVKTQTHVETAPHNFPGGAFADGDVDVHMEMWFITVCSFFIEHMDQVPSWGLCKQIQAPTEVSNLSRGWGYLAFRFAGDRGRSPTYRMSVGGGVPNKFAFHPPEDNFWNSSEASPAILSSFNMNEFML